MKKYRNMNGCWPSSFDIAWNWIDPVAPCTLITPQHFTPHGPRATLMPEWCCFAQVTKVFLIGNPNGHMLAFIFIRQPLALPFSNICLPWTWLSWLLLLPSTLVCRAPCRMPCLVPGFHPSLLFLSPGDLPSSCLCTTPKADFSSHADAYKMQRPQVQLVHNQIIFHCPPDQLSWDCWPCASPSGLPVILLVCSITPSPSLLPPDHLLLFRVFHPWVRSSLFLLLERWDRGPSCFSDSFLNFSDLSCSVLEISSQPVPLLKTTPVIPYCLPIKVY